MFVSRVKDMSGMFAGSQFNGDISNWDVSRVENMSKTFYLSYKFDGDISKWDVSGVKCMDEMFDNYKPTDGIPKWYLSKKDNKECVVKNVTTTPANDSSNSILSAIYKQLLFIVIMLAIFYFVK